MRWPGWRTPPSVAALGRIPPPEEVLGRVSALSQLPPASLRALVPFVDQVRLAAGTVILRRGEQLRHLYLVAAGSAATIGPSGEVAFFEQGGPVGLDELFTDAFSPYTIVAMTEVDLLTMRLPQFGAACETIPSFAYRLLRARCRQGNSGFADPLLEVAPRPSVPGPSV